MEFKVSTIHRGPYLPNGYDNFNIINIGGEIDLSDMDIGQFREVVYFNERLSYYGINKYQRVK